MTKYLISAAVAALMAAPVYADTAQAADCQVVDHGGYKAFARGCEKLNGTNGRDRAPEYEGDNSGDNGGSDGDSDNGGDNSGSDGSDNGGSEGGYEGGSEGGDNGAE